MSSSTKRLASRGMHRLAQRRYEADLCRQRIVDRHYREAQEAAHLTQASLKKSKPTASTILSWIFFWVAGLLFLFLSVRLTVTASAPPFAPLTVGAALILLVVVFRLLQRCERFLEKHYTFLLAGFLGCYMLAQIINANLLRFQPSWDMDAIYQGAIDWVETGTFSDYFEYYYWFPNNLGGMAFLAFFFSIAHSVGITDYFMAASIVNAILAAAAILATASICRKLLGVTHAVFTLVLFAVSLPFWFMAPVFYTDSLSILFPVLVLFLYLEVRASVQWQRQILFAVLLGAAAAAGALVKPTVLIMVVAVVLDSLLHRPLARTLRLAAVSVVVISTVLLSFQAAMYSSFLDREIAQERNTPYLHWVMMGLKGDGGYNPEDYEFTRSFDNPDERDAALREEISRRASDLGPGGLYELFWSKTLRTFGSGTYNQESMLDDNPENLTPLHDFLLDTGASHKTYSDICSIVWIALLFLTAVSNLQEVVLPGGGKNETAQKHFGVSVGGDAAEGRYEPSTWNDLASRAAMLGVMLFFACWETDGRYITNFVPVIVVCAVIGIRGASSLIQWVWTATLRVLARDQKAESPSCSPPAEDHARLQSG